MSKSDAKNERRQIFQDAMRVRAGGPRTIYAHEQVVDTAKGLARQAYEDLMKSDNELYADWKNMCPELTPALCEEMFVELMYPCMLEPARAILARMLANPAYSTLHESIYDALVKDNVLRAGRNADPRRARLDINTETGEVKETRH